MIDELRNFLGEAILHCLFMANPYCSDDAIAYHIYYELMERELPEQLRIYFSYSIDVEEILLSLDNTSKVILVDAIKSDETNPIFVSDIISDRISTHKAEWSIINGYCKMNNIELAAILIPVTNTEYTGRIQDLPERLNKIRDDIVSMLAVELFSE